MPVTGSRRWLYLKQMDGASQHVHFVAAVGLFASQGLCVQWKMGVKMHQDRLVIMGGVQGMRPHVSRCRASHPPLPHKMMLMSKKSASSLRAGRHFWMHEMKMKPATGVGQVLLLSE